MDPWTLVDYVCELLCERSSSVMTPFHSSSTTRKRSRHDDLVEEQNFGTAVDVIGYRKMTEPILLAFRRLICQPVQWRTQCRDYPNDEDRQLQCLKEALLKITKRFAGNLCAFEIDMHFSKQTPPKIQETSEESIIRDFPRSSDDISSMQFHRSDDCLPDASTNECIGPLRGSEKANLSKKTYPSLNSSNLTSSNANSVYQKRAQFKMSIAACTGRNARTRYFLSEITWEKQPDRFPKRLLMKYGSIWNVLRAILLIYRQTKVTLCVGMQK